jgi:N-acetylglucosaminyldiphosphoundecaprenol N-acetyl-beta-D-mannosaminyltransferase
MGETMLQTVPVTVKNAKPVGSSRATTQRYSCARPYVAGFSILGARLNAVSVDDVHGYISAVIGRKERALILNLNVHCVNLCQKHRWLKDFVNQAQMVFCDGDGVRWAARLLGHHAPPKITYDRWIWQLAEFAVQKDYRVFFLGGKPGVAEEAAERIKKRFPRLNIAGTQHGYFQKEGVENEQVVTKINRSKCDILILGLGMPIQEQWLRDNWQVVESHIFLTGGAVFDYVSGRAKRAPFWMIRLNLEWLFRLLQEPTRLCTRYLWGNPYFMFKVLQAKLVPKQSVK